MLRSTPILLILFMMLQACTNEQNSTKSSPNFELIPLADGVYSCIHKFGGRAICNVGVINNGNETLIFDSFLVPDVAKELLDLLDDMGLPPVKYVLNSHYHNDHIRGNQVFSEDVKIISTSQTMELIAAMEPLEIASEKEGAPARYAYYDSLYVNFNGDKESREYQQIMMWRPYYHALSNSHLEVKTRIPDLALDSVLNLDGPLRKVQVITRGEGHTASDLVLHLPDDEIIFTGDLVFNDCHPYVAHGNIPKWIKWLDFISSLDVSTVMPGHGKIGSEVLIGEMKTYLLDLVQRAEEIKSDVEPIDQIENTSIPSKYKDWWFDRFYQINLDFAYQSLEENEAH